MRYLIIVFFVASIFTVTFGGSFSANAQESKDERRARLEAELAEIEKQMARQEVLVNSKGQERQSLERDVAILDAQIKKAQLAIQARTIEIQQLGTQIGDKQIAVNELSGRVDRQRQSLGQLIRKTNEIDDYTLVEIMLGNQNFSHFFEDLDSFQSIKASLKESVTELTEVKEVTLEEKQSLEDRQASEVELRRLQELEKKEIEVHEAEKARILKITKGEEAAYQQLLQEQRKTAAQIRTQLFELRDSTAIPFEEALRLANFASAKTGVRAALILGVLTQETRLGENLGVVGRWRTDMHPTRDVPIFEIIMATLGLDPDSMPVSARPSYGWGGAMGPAQFIPSTWVHYGGYTKNAAGVWVYDKGADRIRQLTGKSTPSNPYDNQDAFMASALLMADNGAARGTYEAERLAALRYFAGWGNASNPSYAFYGDGVMSHAARIQAEINILNAN